MKRGNGADRSVAGERSDGAERDGEAARDGRAAADGGADGGADGTAARCRSCFNLATARRATHARSGRGRARIVAAGVLIMKSFDSLIGPVARAAMRDDNRIREVISRIVPAEALAHVTFCRLSERQLRITLDSAAWVPRLRFSERQLLAALAREGLEARTVSWHVAPAKNPGVRAPSRRVASTASTHAARAVLSAAASIDDPELAGQMRRMAERLGGRRAGRAADEDDR